MYMIYVNSSYSFINGKMLRHTSNPKESHKMTNDYIKSNFCYSTDFVIRVGIRDIIDCVEISNEIELFCSS